MIIFFLILSWIIVGWLAHREGRNSGYNLGYDRGYHQCCKDNKIKVSSLEYFQDRGFEVETGIHQAREFEKEIKGEKSIEENDEE